jgi:anti-anti-sigma factor
MTTGSMRFKRSLLEGTDSIEITGPFDTNDPQIDDAIKDIINEGKTTVVFNFTHVAYMTSPGVAVMIKAIKHFQAVQGTVSIYGATPDIKSFLSLSRIDEFLKFI